MATFRDTSGIIVRIRISSSQNFLIYVVHFETNLFCHPASADHADTPQPGGINEFVEDTFIMLQINMQAF